MILRNLRCLAIFLSLLFFCQQSFSASIIKMPDPVANRPEYVKASVFVKLSAKEFSRITGTKLNFLQKLYFKTVQSKLASEVNQNPDLLISQYYDHKKAKFKIAPLWFVLGAILGPVGILFAFTSKQKKDKRKSAMLGGILFVIWFGLLFIF